MSVWLDTRGNTVLSIAICDRCKMKRAYSDISMDRNIPGLRVCNNGCNDERDPYRLPARQPEKIAIRFPRPDAPLDPNDQAITTDPNVVTAPNQTVTGTTAGEYGIAPETSQDDLNGNLDNLSP
jgi:hypothetical protein